MNVENTGNRVAPPAQHKGDAAHGRAKAPADAATGQGAISFLSLLESVALPSADPLADASAQSGAFPGGVASGNVQDQDPALLQERAASDSLAQNVVWLVATGGPGDGNGTQAVASPLPLPAATGGLRGGGSSGGPDAAPAAAAFDADGWQAGQGGRAMVPDDTGTARAGAVALADAAAAASAQDDGARGSPRDFLARVQAARVAADTDAASTARAGAPAPGPATVQQQVASLFDVAAAGVRDTTWRGSERVGQRFGRPGEAATENPGAQGGIAPGTHHGASPVYAPGATTPAPAAAVADKVVYWMSRGVQNAQLQLDAFEGGAVDVSISVKGNEALVEFRTDQPQARRLLLEAMPHLREMLEAEGLSLTGGFVGQSTQQRDSDPQGHGARHQDARKALVRAVGAPSVQPLQNRLQGAPGGAIDLFV